jgi:hypothetical protein
MKKIRKKWALTVISFSLTVIFWSISTYFNYKEIPIQENYIAIVKVLLNFIKWIFAFMFGGYALKLWHGEK